jgi:diguanylate cyclase (GGDEF)-like protein
VLIAAADLLGLEMRSYCTLARLGGDEFVMMIPGADLEQGRLAAERLLDHLRRNPVKVGGQRIEIGVSIGVAVYPGSGTTAGALLEAADDAMYESKRAGRGRVTVVAPSAETADAAEAAFAPARPLIDEDAPATT